MNIAIKCFCISIFSFCFLSAYSQQKIEYSIGISANYSDRLESENGQVFSLIGTDNTINPKVGMGLHIRALSKLDQRLNFSFGPSLKFKSVEEFSSVVATDLEINFPLLLHLKLFNNLELQTGASYDFLIHRAKKLPERNIDVTDFSPNRHFVTPTLGLAYIVKNHLELNLSYHLSLQDKDKAFLTDLSGNEIGNLDYKDHYLQFAVFFRNMGKFKKGKKNTI